MTSTTRTLKDNKDNALHPHAHGPRPGHHGEILDRENYSIRSYTDPVRNLQFLNDLLRKVDSKLLCSNLRRAIQTREICEVIPKLRELFKCSRKWHFFPLTLEDIEPTLQSFFRWLILTYGGTSLWNNFAKEQNKYLQDRLDDIKTLRMKKKWPLFLTRTEHELQFCIDLLHENMALDCVGGSFHLAEDGHPVIDRRSTGYSNFTKENHSHIQMSPTKLLFWLDHTLRAWREAVHKIRPDLVLPPPHRHYHPVDSSSSGAHVLHTADKHFLVGLEEFARLLKNLTAPATTTNAQVIKHSRKSSFKVHHHRCHNKMRVRFTLYNEVQSIDGNIARVPMQ